MKRNPLEATADSVATAIGLLWDWLGADVRDDDSAPNVLELLSGSETISSHAKGPHAKHGAPARDPEIFDTDGEET